jgi:glycosyltransferase involved in cell wall biosynthesis
MIVHQLLSGAGPFDAITSEALMFRAAFNRWGWGGGEYAARIAPGLGGSVSALERLPAKRGDVLLLHHSAHFPYLEELLAQPARKLLLYHNITPPKWLWAVAPVVALHCDIGRAQLPRVVAGVDAVAADSAFNAAELGVPDAHVVPLLVEPDRLGPPRSAPAAPPGDPHLLFVGRLSPHKRQDAVIRILARLRAHRYPGARLTLVGDALTVEYMETLRRVADDLAPGAVRIETNLSNAELGERYRAADVFVCQSAHEGFCVPVLEAFRMGVPVVALATGAVPEVAGDAALLTAAGDDEAVVAEAVAAVVADIELRDELIRRGHDRAQAFAPPRVEEQLRTALDAALA